MRAGAHSGGKIFNLLDGIRRQHDLGEFGKIEPFVWRTLQATIIEVEAVNINVGLCQAEGSFGGSAARLTITGRGHIIDKVI